MIKSIVAICILVFTCEAFGGLEIPVVDVQKKTVTLGKDVTLALRMWKGEAFKLYRYDDYMEPVKFLFESENNELPMAVVGRFNEDKTLDVVFMGHTQKQTYILLAVSDEKKRKYNIWEVKSFPRSDLEGQSNSVNGESYSGLSTYLSLFSGAKTKAQKGRDLFQIEVYRSPATKSYIFKNKVIQYSK